MSEITPPLAATDGTTVVTAPPEDPAAEAARWKAQAQKHEREWIKFSKENEQLKQGLMSDAEKAIEKAAVEAKAAGWTEARQEFAQRLAAAEIRAALTGIFDDPNSVIEDLNLARYVTPEGDVDAKAVAALRDKYAGLVGRRTTPDLGQGNRGVQTPANGGDVLRQMREDLRGRKAR